VTGARTTRPKGGVGGAGIEILTSRVKTTVKRTGLLKKKRKHELKLYIDETCRKHMGEGAKGGNSRRDTFDKEKTMNASNWKVGKIVGGGKRGMLKRGKKGGGKRKKTKRKGTSEERAGAAGLGAYLSRA